MAGDCSGPKSAEAVLLHPRVEAAVLETARGGIMREGLAFDKCTVGVVTNISPDHLGIGGVNTLEDLAKVKQVVIEAVDKSGFGVLNADDPLVAEMAAACSGKVVYFGLSRQNPVLSAHIAEGGPCVFVADGALHLHADSHATALVDFDRVPFTAQGRIHFQVANALAAVAAAWAVGINPAIIVRALTTFKTDTATTPGRFNRLEIEGVEIILDYGHNVAAMRALAQAVSALDPRRNVMVLGLPGDRRDIDITATAKATDLFVDQYFLHDLSDRRSRDPDELPRLIQAALPAGKPAAIFPDQAAAVRAAWPTLRKGRGGDRLIIIADVVDEALDLVHSLASGARADAYCQHPLEAPATPAGNTAYADAH